MPRGNGQTKEPTKGALRSRGVNGGIAAILAAATAAWGMYTGAVPVTPETVGSAALGAAGGVLAIIGRNGASKRISGLL